ncbi:Suppressor of profilin [Hyphodiscus hymeniophilus]|uniref:Suppressor of profilin n=1 Tax=Hyphodiscus hymeniophilus TaxID=353542 RepID=A0A9P6VKN4_9HELO|nr:Suppressor of profilin [Hyphodiscus hymeniophilus]
MADALSRREYPAILERLPPTTAVAKFSERVKKIGKINIEIADWLLERRKVEEAYVTGLRKLSKRPLQEIGGDLGIFDAPWRKILNSTETIASSHSTLSQRIEQDVEQPLRSFASTNREMSGMNTIQSNLGNMAKELDDAQDKSDKLSKKGGKASAQKVDAASSRLQTATQQWEAQAPFVFEKLQALDESRLNHLRDVLTQYETHEADQLERNRITVEQTLRSLLEIDSSQEIKNWSQATASAAGKSITERSARQLSNAGSGSFGGSFGAGVGATPPPQTPRSNHTDNASEHSGKQDAEKSDSKFSKSRFGTMLGRRRQSIQGGFNRAPSPSKGGFAQFGRNTASRDGRPNPSPRASSNSLWDESTRDNRLSSLVESPTATSPISPNGTHPRSAFVSDAIPEDGSSNAPNGSAEPALPDLSDVQPPPGPPPSHFKPASENRRDSDGFTVPGAMNDPISQAQQEAAQEAAQSQFKLDIQPEPIQDHDADAQAALSNVANTLRSSQMTPSRKAGTVRGRRDVRNTIFVPSHSNSLDVISPEHPLPPSPGVVAGRAATLATLSSGDQAPSVSDSTSIRSGHSLANNLAIKHPEMHQPGLNASIVETIHASTENGETKTLKINGEISLVFNRPPGDELSVTSENETIRINNFTSLDAIGENRTFIHPVSEEKPDEFTLALAPISTKPMTGFNYRVHVDETNLSSQTPLLIKPTWNLSRNDRFDFIVEYRLNPAYSTEPVTFHNFGIIARYTGGRPTACQSKPSGTFKAQQSCVYWRWAEMTLTNEPRKLVCRLIVAEGAMPVPSHIDAKWEMQGSAAGLSLSRLDPGKGKDKEESVDPFADDTIASPAPVTPTGNWAEIETSRKLITGKYEARGGSKAE